MSGGLSGLVGYRAKRHTGVVDVDAPKSCAIADYWEEIDSRGSRRLILDPAVPVGKDLDWVNASLITRHGKVESAWKKDGNAVTWNFSVPPNTSATLQPPQGAVLEKMTATGAEPLSLDASGTVVGTGTYRMRWSTTSSL
jgi:hypothetical protein